ARNRPEGFREAENAGTNTPGRRWVADRKDRSDLEACIALIATSADEVAVLARDDPLRVLSLIPAVAAALSQDDRV
ncbi:MAG: hypothetical protein LC808_31550, partial [Actinobacteria bacterium]|nr:hypothetical protein [Actinomycetota bacterium]